MSKILKTIRLYTKVQTAQSEVNESSRTLETAQGKLKDAQRELKKECCHPRDAHEEQKVDQKVWLVCSLCGTHLAKVGE